jgi:hypothetical protein
MARTSSASPDDAGQKQHQLEQAACPTCQARVPELVDRVSGLGMIPFISPLRSFARHFSE